MTRTEILKAREWRAQLEGVELPPHSIPKPTVMVEMTESIPKPKQVGDFSPSEVELEEIAREILEQVERAKSVRLVLDSLSEIRLLAEDPFRYRRELLARGGRQP